MKKIIVRPSIIAVVFAAVIMTLTLTQLVSAAPATVTNGKIYFASGPSASEVHSVVPDGTNETTIYTAPSGSGINSLWTSPDGKKIVVLIQTLGGFGDMFVMNIDGTGVQQITTGENTGQAFFSPDSSKIVFRDVSSGQDAISIINVDGTGRALITSNPDDIVYQWADNGKLVFVRRDGTANPANGIYSMNADGSGQQLLRASGAGGTNAMIGFLNSAGDKLMYTELNPTGTSGNVFLADANGQNSVQLTTDNVLQVGLFTPDQAKIVVYKIGAGPGGTPNLVTINFDGTVVRTVNIAASPLSLAISWAAIVTPAVADVSTPVAAAPPASLQPIKVPNTGSGSNQVPIIPVLIASVISGTVLIAMGIKLRDRNT